MIDKISVVGVYTNIGYRSSCERALILLGTVWFQLNLHFWSIF